MDGLKNDVTALPVEVYALSQNSSVTGSVTISDAVYSTLDTFVVILRNVDSLSLTSHKLVMVSAER